MPLSPSRGSTRGHRTGDGPLAGDSLFTPTEVRADLDKLEKLIKRLGVEYEMFLSQQVRWMPTRRRAEVEAILRHYTKHPPRQTSERFRFNTLVHRFRTSIERWSRRQRMMEENGVALGRGAERGSSQNARREIDDPDRPQVLLTTTAREGSSQGEQLRELYRTYRTARKARGQAIASLSYAPFARKMEALLEKARAKSGNGDVELRVAEAGGKVTVSARPLTRRG